MSYTWWHRRTAESREAILRGQEAVRTPEGRLKWVDAFTYAAPQREDPVFYSLNFYHHTAPRGALRELLRERAPLGERAPLQERAAW